MNAEQQAAYEAWCKANGVERVPPPNPRYQVREEIKFLERRLERKRDAAKHAPTARDREKALARADAIEDQIIELSQSIGEGIAMTWDEIAWHRRHQRLCRYCGDQMTAEESWACSGVCPLCIANAQLKGATSE